jgi:6-phosphogluconolactonase
MTTFDANDLYVGAYGAIHPLTHAGGQWRLAPAFEHGRNASYGAFDAALGVHYLVDEKAQGQVAAFAAQAQGWRRLSSARVGNAPCFVSVAPGGGALAVANYAGGSVSLLPLADDGAVRPGSADRGVDGSGPLADRQNGPHVHCARFHGGRLYFTDLGADRVYACRWEPGIARLGQPTC